jgi:hypothetical protein
MKCKTAVSGHRLAYATTMLPLLLLLTLPVVLQAQFYSYPFYYSTNNNAVTIIAYNGSGGAVNIPSTISGLPVTSIGANAFYNTFYNNYSARLTNVTIPDSVITIGTNAFGFCTNLTNVTIGTNVTSIDDESFYNCTKLTSVTIPSAVTNIGAGAFANCPSLTGITVDPRNPVYSSVDGVLFNQIQSTLIQCPQGIVGAFMIPSGVTAITDQAFQYCGSLTSVTIPDSITNMGNSTFQYCTSLTNVNIGTSVTSIGVGVFMSCSKLVNFMIPYGVTSIGDQAFQYCGSLTSIAIPNCVTNIGNLTFEYCTNLSSAGIGTNVTSIGYGDFSYDANLINVTFPNSITAIGALAFNGCTSLSSATIPDSVTSIGADAFAGCGLTTLRIGNGVTSIGPSALEGLTRLTTSVTIPSSVTNIGDYGLAVDWRVKAFFFQGNAPSIGPNTFWDDFNQTVYYLPGTSGWTNTFGGIPAVLWNPQAQTSDGSFGVQNNQFGFNITGTTNIPIVVAGCTNLAKGAWIQLQTTTLTNGSFYFADTKWTNYLSRFYRISSP